MEKTYVYFRLGFEPGSFHYRDDLLAGGLYWLKVSGAGVTGANTRLESLRLPRVSPSLPPDSLVSHHHSLFIHLTHW